MGARAEVYVDGGIRRGTDVLKALSLGARAVLVGRPVLWGLALSGSEGVNRVLSILRRIGVGDDAFWESQSGGLYGRLDLVEEDGPRA